MLEHLEGKKYQYSRPDGFEFKLVQKHNEQWHTLQVGDIFHISNMYFKVLEIHPNKVIMEKVEGPVKLT